MLLPLLIIIIASAALYLAWKSCRNTTEKAVVISSYLLVIAICYKYISLIKMQTTESFVVEMPDIDEMFEEELANSSQNEAETTTTEAEVAETTTTEAGAETTTTEAEVSETTTTEAAVAETTTTEAVTSNRNNNSPVKFINENTARKYGNEDLSGLAAMVKGANGPTTMYTSTETTRPMTSANNSFGDLPGSDIKHTEHMSTDEFTNISQEKTDGMSSVFNPQIIINNPGGVSSGASGEYVDYYSPERFTGPQSGSPDGKPMPSKTIKQYLEPDSSLFGSYDNTYLNKYDNSRLYGNNRRGANNGFQDNTNSAANNGESSSNNGSNATSDEWDITKNLIANNKATPSGSNSAKNNKQPGSCVYDISRPFAEDKGKFNTTTLNNKSFVPGMSYLPPTEWSVPQYHPTTCRAVCPTTMPNTRELPIGIMDHGTPIFALEIGSDGNIAKTEDEVTLTNVGSICPKFVYREYVECPSKMYAGRKGPLTTLTKPGNV